jgi:TonB family protein
MLIRIANLLCFALSMTMVAAAQADEPVLTSLNMPKFPPLARQARVEGIVKLTFTLAGWGTEPTNIRVISGHPVFNSPTIENIRTWRFNNNNYAVERKYEITFEYRLAGQPGICFESFHKVTVTADEAVKVEPNF